MGSEDGDDATVGTEVGNEEGNEDGANVAHEKETQKNKMQ